MQTTDDDLRNVMEEPPNGFNNGARTKPDPDAWSQEGIDRFGIKFGLNTEWQKAHEFMRSGGFGTVDSNAGTHTGRTYGYQDIGMTSPQRGTLHPDDFVDHDALLEMVESHLGFSFDEVRSVYTRAGGPLPTALRELRSRIDARLLELHTADHINLVEFSRVMGLTEMGMHRALGRARQVRNA